MVADNHLGEGFEGPAIGIALIDAVRAHVTGNIIAGPKFGVLVSGGNVRALLETASNAVTSVFWSRTRCES